MATRTSFVLGLLFLSWCCCFVDASLSQQSTEGPIVLTSNGAIQGLEYPEAYAFLGVPYATPPVGAMRWQSPQPIAPWQGVYSATSNKPGCPQHCELPPLGCPATQSEDCLAMNIWLPLNVNFSSGSLPVGVFLPGGHFEQGTIATVLYNGQYVVNHTSIILIEMGYRLGALGWLRTKDGLTGQFGLQDQRVALQWIQRNIEAFGGDPTQVTIWGQSAGATSIMAHLVSPLSQGLFSKAIAESHPWTLQLKDLTEAEALGEKFLEGVNCNSGNTINETLACLQTASVDDILNVQHDIQAKINYIFPIRAFYPFTPVVDGTDEVPGQPIELIPEGKYSQMPIMMGTVANESNIFIYQAFTEPMSETLYLALLTDVFKEYAPEVIARYPPHLYQQNDTRLSLSSVITHWVFTCPTRFIARATANFDTTYLYWFNHVWSFAVPGWGPNYTYCYDQVCHGSELPYVFHAGDFPGVFNFTSAEYELSQSMVAFWANFIASGNTNQPFPTGTNAYWPTYDQSSDTLLVFSTPNDAVASVGFDDTICDFWDRVGYTSWG